MPGAYTIGVVDRRIEIVYQPDSGLPDRLEAVDDAARLLAEYPGYGILVDRRGTTRVFAGAEERLIAEQIARYASAFSGGIAMVANPGEQYDAARQEEAYAALQGVDIGVFRDRAEAVAWLDERCGGQKSRSGD